MKHNWIILFLFWSIPFTQNVIGEGLYEYELINFLQNNYKTSSTLGYTAARDTLYLRIDQIDGQVKGVYTNFAVDLPEMINSVFVILTFSSSKNIVDSKSAPGYSVI